MFEELVKELLYSWQNADAEQVEEWARGEAWAELQALAQCKAAQQSVQPTLLESPRHSSHSCECGLCKGSHTTLPQSG